MGRQSRFDAGFRFQAVEMVKASKRSRCDIASDLGVSDTTLTKWMNESAANEVPDPLTLNERAELDRLRVERRDWIVEREILKKVWALTV